jgi:CSLREA domain-containing protein
MARRLSIALVILLVVGALLSPISPRAVRAATLSVTSTADSGPGSLRDVIASAAPNDTVTFDPTLFSTPQTITLTSPITIAKNLTIQGPGANLVALDGNNAVQIFKLSLADIVLSGLTFQHGYSQVVESTTVLSVYDCVFVDNEGIPISQAVNGKLIVNNSTFTNNHGSYSGGISNNDYSSAIISNSTFTNNSGAYYGGALTNSNDSIMSVSNSTFTGNTVGYYGGAIGNYSNAKLIVNNSTFINNWSLYYGGAIVNVNLSTVNINNSTFSGNNSGNGGAIYSASSQVSINGSTISGNSSPNGGGIHSVISASPLVRLSQTIVANNINGPMSSTPNSPNDIRGSVISDGTNLIGNTIGALGLVSGDLQNVNPMLGPLQNNGGATHTMALSAGSPAIDALSVCPGVVDDQRTTQRPADGDGNSSKLCDIGAYEVNALAGPLSLTVDTANDTNDGTCSGGCSLREAIALIGSLASQPDFVKQRAWRTSYQQRNHDYWSGGQPAHGQW